MLPPDALLEKNNSPSIFQHLLKNIAIETVLYDLFRNLTQKKKIRLIS
jgi:hypothetical protein